MKLAFISWKSMKIHAMCLCLVEFPWTIPIEYTSTGFFGSAPSGRSWCPQDPPGSPRYIINVFTPLNFLGDHLQHGVGPINASVLRCFERKFLMCFRSDTLGRSNLAAGKFPTKTQGLNAKTWQKPSMGDVPPSYGYFDGKLMII